MLCSLAGDLTGATKIVSGEFEFRDAVCQASRCGRNRLEDFVGVDVSATVLHGFLKPSLGKQPLTSRLVGDVSQFAPNIAQLCNAFADVVWLSSTTEKAIPNGMQVAINELDGVAAAVAGRERRTVERTGMAGLMAIGIKVQQPAKCGGTLGVRFGAVRKDLDAESSGCGEVNILRQERV